MARTMADMAEKLEDEFWVDLEAFEQNIEEVDPTLGGVAAAMDVAAGTVEELAGVAYDSIANWFKSVETAEKEAQLDSAGGGKRPKKLDFAQRDQIQEYVVEFDNDAPASPLDYQFYKSTHQSLRDHYAEVLHLRYRYVAQKELEDIDLNIKNGVSAGKNHLDEREEDAEFEGMSKKNPNHTASAWYGQARC